MSSTVTEIATDLFRISTVHPGFGIQFNQFVLRDDEPFLMHTGLKRMFPATLEAVSTVLDPAALRWIGFSHFEPDECGALNDWLAVAPRAQAVCSLVGKTVMLDDVADRPARPLADGEVLPTGRHRLRFLSTPHVPHCWDAGLLYEETTGTLFTSDLFTHAGDPAPVTGGDIAGPAMVAEGRFGFTAVSPATSATIRRLAGLEPRTLAVMHGSSYSGAGAPVLESLAGFYDDLLRKGAATARG
jgi:flavorubredoxin